MVGTYSWGDVARAVLNLPEHIDLKVMKWSVPHPLEAGFREGLGDPVGQKANYRLALFDGRGLHVKEYDNYYLIHWDRWDPSIYPLRHIFEDAPHLLPVLGVLGILTTISVGALVDTVAKALRKRKE